MKHAGRYKPKLARLIKKGLPKGKKDDDAKLADPIGAMLVGILEANTTARQAEKAIKAIEREYVDFNELRVSPIRDMVECVGEGYPDVQERARTIKTVLGSIFAQCNGVSLDYLAKLPKRDLRRRLTELGLNEYASGMAILMGLGMHAIPVDRDLAKCLEMDGCVHPGSDMDDIQGFVERAVPKQRARAGHDFLRQYVRKKAKALAKMREEAAAAEAAAEAKAKAAAEAEAAAKAEKTRKEAEKKKAARKKAARKRAAKKRTAKKTTAKKRTAKKTSAAAGRSAGRTRKAAATKSGKKAPTSAGGTKKKKAAGKTAAKKPSTRSARKKK